MKKIIILGAGVVGVTSAYFLRQKGHEVKVIEAGATPGLGTSFANGSQLSYSKTHPLSSPETIKNLPKLLFSKNTPVHIHPKLDLAFMRWGVQFLRESLPRRSHNNSEKVLDIAMKSRLGMHKIIMQHNISFDYARRGKIYLFDKKREFIKSIESIDDYREHGIELKSMTANEIVDLEPALRDMKQNIEGAIYSKIDESGDAKKFTEELARICAEMGVEFEYNTRIDNFRVENGKITAALSNEKEFTADNFVICLGTDTPALLKKIGIRVPIYPMKGYSLTVPARFAPEINITDEGRRVVYSKIGDRLRIAGIAEFAGWKMNINRKIMDGMIAAAKASFPHGGDYSQLTEWVGLRPMTPSTVPIIGKTEKFSNLYLNTGHGMLGWTLACGSAEVLASQF